MHDFFVRQRENLIANLVASVIFAGLAAIVTWASSLPPVAVPAWLFIAAGGFLAAWWWFSRTSRKLKPVVNETYGVEQVSADGKHFADCKFIGSEIVFRGAQNFSLKDCEISPLRLKFEGPAGVTLAQLVALNSDAAFRPFVQQALNGSPTNAEKP